jgi:hypothetical protein
MVAIKTKKSNYVYPIINICSNAIAEIFVRGEDGLCVRE